MLVLDANILIRAALGSRVLCLLRKYADHVEFLAPDTAFQEAREWLPEILERRKVPVAPAMTVLELVAGLVQTVESETYSQFEALARERIDRRDEEDWPILTSDEPSYVGQWDTQAAPYRGFSSHAEPSLNPDSPGAVSLSTSLELICRLAACSIAPPAA